jgi:hypothetical protein
MVASSCQFILEQDLIAEQKQALADQAKKEKEINDADDLNDSLNDLQFGVSI